MIEIALIAAAYLLGSIPTGYILGSLAGVDVRKEGSGNLGATNVARVLGIGRGLLTLAIDVGKGVLAVLIARQLDVSLPWQLLAGAASFLGHLYPVFLWFRGGKGVATALGVFLYLAPVPTLVLMGIFAVTVAASRIVSLGSLIAAVSAPIVFWMFALSPPVIVMAGFIAAMITCRHRGNIQRLLSGTEPKFGSASSR
jgi:glycerol-3-phosphate acyltransferase PlsY